MNTTNEKSNGALWSWEENKALEVAVAIYDEDTSDSWEKIAAAVPGRSIAEIKQQFQRLVEDIKAIEAGHDPDPPFMATKDAHSGPYPGGFNHGGTALRSDKKRQKAKGWTEDEHRLFLLGLEKYGKGAWQSISKKLVVSKTPIQVASHAQKYFIRSKAVIKKRASIHDVTIVWNGDIPAATTGESKASIEATKKSTE